MRGGARRGGDSGALRAAGPRASLTGLVGLLAETGQMPVEVAAAVETGLLGAATAGLRVEIRNDLPALLARLSECQFACGVD